METVSGMDNGKAIEGKAIETSSPSGEPTLAILGNQPAPEFLVGDLQTLLALPETAQKKFWKVLASCLDEQLSPEVDKAIDAFANQHDTGGKMVAEAVRGCRFLLLESARRNVEEHVLAMDLTTLGGDRAERLREIVLEGFVEAKEKVRSGLVQNAIAEHGRVLEGASFRLDQMMFSQGGIVDAPVAMLTLACREGAERSRFTVQADLPTLFRLRAMLDQAIGEGPAQPSAENS